MLLGLCAHIDLMCKLSWKVSIMQSLWADCADKLELCFAGCILCKFNSSVGCSDFTITCSQHH